MFGVERNWPAFVFAEPGVAGVADSAAELAPFSIAVSNSLSFRWLNQFLALRGIVWVKMGVFMSSVVVFSSRHDTLHLTNWSVRFQV